MKILVVSDLHGSTTRVKQLLQAAQREQPDRIITLGDLIYKGVMTDIAPDYCDRECVAMLNTLADRISGVRGNCDAEVHQEFLHFPMLADYLLISDGGRTIFATHGHLYNEEHLPALQPGDVLLQGHIHLTTWHQKDGVRIFNPGSPTLPKQDTRRGYMIIEDGRTFRWKDIETGEEFHTEVLE